MEIYRQRASHSEGIGRSHRDWIYLEIFLIFAYCLRSPVCSKKFAFEADVTFPTTGQKIIEWAFVEILHFKIMTYPRINALNISSDRALRRRIVRLRSLLCDTKWEVFCEGFMFISNRWCKVKSIVFVDICSTAYSVSLPTVCLQHGVETPSQNLIFCELFIRVVWVNSYGLFSILIPIFLLCWFSGNFM